MLKTIAGHAIMILSGMYIVFFLIDRVNTAMAFINNRYTKFLLLIFCALSAYLALAAIYERRAEIRAQEQGRPAPAKAAPTREAALQRKPVSARPAAQTRPAAPVRRVKAAEPAKAAPVRAVAPKPAAEPKPERWASLQRPSAPRHGARPAERSAAAANKSSSSWRDTVC